VRLLEEAAAMQEGGGAGGASMPDVPPGVAPASAQEFAGTWEQTLDGVTHQEILELEVSGDQVVGLLTELDRGYFSSRSRITAEYGLRGAARDGAVDLRIWDASDSPGTGWPARMYRRGEYLLLQVGATVHGYARPGRPLVRSARGSAEAERYLRAIAGRVYGASVQAGGRDGAVTGARVRLALCGDGGIAYDRSDVTSAGGAGFGDAVARRGAWSVVLYAGAPAVRAEWQGTGSTYDLVRYFQVAAVADGRSAVVDGGLLPATGSC
jgi:hypothetical protein